MREKGAPGIRSRRSRRKNSMMEENSFDRAYDSLDHITGILNEMLWMSARIASDECGDAERTALRRDFDALREKVNEFTDRYENAAASMAVERISRIMAIMETE